MAEACRRGGHTAVRQASPGELPHLWLPNVAPERGASLPPWPPFAAGEAGGELVRPGTFEEAPGSESRTFLLSV